uniref:Uncharacterized protein n=1 Tax=uncultured alpha proteobacterium HF0010_30A23 TaxID=710802 RepID=E0XRK4_9PROT|nr:hypothetical protein [uncultured alpha proteobacterium HF0010_30A23]
MELGADHGVSSDHGCDIARVVRDHQLVFSLRRFKSIGMNKVDILTGKPFENRMRRPRLGLSQGIPAHLRDFQGRVAGLDRRDIAGDPVKTLVHTMLQPPRRHQLHPDADAQIGFGLAQGEISYGLQQSVNRLDPCQTIAKSALSGQHQIIGTHHSIGVSGNLHRLTGNALKRLGSGAEVPRPVIDNDNLHGSAVQRAFGRRNLIGRPRVNTRRHTHRAGKSLEAGFSAVVTVLTIQDGNMNIGLRRIGHGLEELTEQLGFHGPQSRHLKGRVPDQMRAAGEIDHSPRQRLVHRHVGVAIAVDPSLVPQGFLERLAQHKADILSGVVRINVQITFGFDGQVDECMLTQQVEHVVKEANAGRNLVRTGAIEVKGQGNVGFTGCALQRYGPRG